MAGGQIALFTAEEAAGPPLPQRAVCECGEPIEGVPVECGADGAVWWSHAATGSPYCARPRFARPALTATMTTAAAVTEDVQETLL